jgi:steroid delta-isomerase-like uncharacterized protein
MATANQVVQRNMDAFNAKDMDAFIANQCPEVEFVLPGGITIRGRDEVRQQLQANWTAFPDGTVTCMGQVATGDGAATEILFTGTHTGPLSTPNGTLPPTGRRISLRQASVHRIEDGLAASEHVYFDQVELMTQLGLSMAPPSVAVPVA